MRAVLIVLFASLLSAQEIKRPTSDIDGGAISGLGCSGTNKPSTAMPLSYDAAGLPTASAQVFEASTNGIFAVTRVFKNWQTTAHGYSAVTLNVNAKSNGFSISDGAGKSCAAYSTDSGATWASIACDTTGNGFPQQTFSFSLSSTQHLNALQVGVCVRANGNKVGFGSDDISVFDIWTEGTLSSTPLAGNGSNKGSARQILIIN